MYLILVILLVLLIVGAIPINGGPYLGTGYYGGGALGLVLVVLLILLLLGRL